MARQQVFSRDDAPRLWAVISEASKTTNPNSCPFPWA
jgi:hypothetical protein